MSNLKTTAADSEHDADDLGNWRDPNNGFGGDCFEAYNALELKSEPVEDWAARNALYAI